MSVNIAYLKEYSRSKNICFFETAQVTYIRYRDILTKPVFLETHHVIL
jgi:hypothetical protein